MEILIFSTLLISTAIQVVTVRYFIQGLLRKLSNEQKTQLKYVESPNQIEETDKNLIDLNDVNPLDLPKELKIEIEGDDVVPPGYNKVN